MTLLRRRAAGRSCVLHGDNGCELQGEVGPRTRALDNRRWRAETADEVPPCAGCSSPLCPDCRRPS